MRTCPRCHEQTDPNLDLTHCLFCGQRIDTEMEDDMTDQDQTQTRGDTTGDPHDARTASQPEVRHTPGPWTTDLEGARGYDAGGFSVETTIDGYPVVICGRAGWPSRADESRANARLIAASPALLAELLAVKAWLDECHSCECDGEGDCMLCSVTTAIAKAEGR